MARRQTYVWYGIMPEIAGEGIEVIAKTLEEARSALRAGFFGVRKQVLQYGIRHPEELSSFERAMDYFGGGIYKVPVGVASTYGGLREISVEAENYQ